ncbi:glutamate--tRNA ligase [Candidatus Gottesmanbacteria bacterium]|nr:glutamate--tRNA ligase [Candidatus Gottesmanbacteria bacterium]
MTAPIRTRIAPSPTGQDLHIGNAYTALINYVVAKKAGGQFIIRIEDTDRTRLVEGSEQRILSSLEWLGIPHAKGPDIGGPYAPYRQSDRLISYRKYAEELVEKGHAYYCFCTSERLEEMRKGQEAEHKPPMYDGLCGTIDPSEAKERITKGERHVIRMRVPDQGVTVFTDLIRGEVSFENALIDDQVILKSDNFPTYHLGVVIDDHEMKITHIIRGEEWISSTPKHILLYQFFGWDIPNIAHVSVLRNPDRSKLSKRKNPVWVSDYKAKGYLPEAILNYLASLAWSYPDGRDVFSVEEMVSVFEIAQLKTSAPIFDVDKLRWMNGEYIRKMDDAGLMGALYAFDPEIPKNDEKMIRILPLVKERMKTLVEFRWLADFFYMKPSGYEKEVNPVLVGIAATALKKIANNWSHEEMEKAIREEAEKSKQKARDVFMDLRVKVTGKTVGPPLLESLEVLGFEETIARLTS